HGFPLIPSFESRRGGTIHPIRTPIAALCADPDVAARCVLDWRQRGSTGGAGGDFLRIDGLKPLAPVRPPRSLVLLGALEPVRQRHVPDIVVGPVLIFA